MGVEGADLALTAACWCFQVVQPFIRFLYRLATLNKDYAVVMCRLGTKDALAKVLDKHSTSLLLASELRDLIGDCEKYASLYKKMTTSILAGCIQVWLDLLLSFVFCSTCCANVCKSTASVIYFNMIDCCC